MIRIRLLTDMASRGQIAVLLNTYRKIAQMEAPESYEKRYGLGARAREGRSPRYRTPGQGRNLRESASICGWIQVQARSTRQGRGRFCPQIHAD